MKALLLVAHPDDEAIFAGALMLSQPKWEWTVACMTYASHDARGVEFDQSIETFTDAGVNITGATMLGVHDTEGAVLAATDYSQWRNAVEALDVRADVVYTHNRRGDYGHGHHMAVSSIAADVYPETERWEFYNPYLSGVGYQDRSSTLRHLWHPHKRDVFDAAYGHRFDGLMYHLPELMRHLLAGQKEEWHTCVSS